MKTEDLGNSKILNLLFKPAGKMMGSRVRKWLMDPVKTLIAMDASSGFLKEVSAKVKKAGLTNVSIVQRDALDTKLETASIDVVLLYGVIPFPLLPLDKLLPEMHRVLKPGGTMSVWLFPPLVHAWVPKVIRQSDLFIQTDDKRHVYNYVRK